MSEEITKAMDEQRSLEQKYASLVTKRGQLKGLSDKEELKKTKEQISVSKLVSWHICSVFCCYYNNRIP